MIHLLTIIDYIFVVRSQNNTKEEEKTEDVLSLHITPGPHMEVKRTHTCSIWDRSQWPWLTCRHKNTQYISLKGSRCFQVCVSTCSCTEVSLPHLLFVGQCSLCVITVQYTLPLANLPCSTCPTPHLLNSVKQNWSVMTLPECRLPFHLRLFDFEQQTETESSVLESQVKVHTD